MVKVSKNYLQRYERSRKLENFFIFGYGSLMYPCGINGRGMYSTYDWPDLKTAVLSGFKRGMFASFQEVGFYGILPSKNHYMNGVVFKINTGHDLRSFLISEGAASGQEKWIGKLTYLLTNVTEHISDVNLPDKARVYTLVCDADNGTMFPPRYGYQRAVYNGIEKWGENFKRVFLSTGGVRPVLKRKKKPLKRNKAR